MRTVARTNPATIFQAFTTFAAPEQRVNKGVFLDIAAGTLIVRDQATSAVTRSHPISTITVAAPCSTTCFGFISDPVPGVDPAGHTMCHVFDGLGAASRILEAIGAQITLLAQAATPQTPASQPSTPQSHAPVVNSPAKVI